MAHSIFFSPLKKNSPISRAYLFLSISLSSSSIGSPTRVRKLITNQSDPLLAEEIFNLSSSLLPSPSLSSLPSLVLKLARSAKFSHSFSLLNQHYRTTRIPASVLSSLTLILSSHSRSDLILSLLNTYRGSIPYDNIKHFNRILYSLASHSSTLHSALSLLKSHDSPSVRSFNVLISAFARNDKLSVAYSLFNAMFKLDLQPDSESYRFLMQGLCRKGQVKTAVEFLEDMHNKGMVPDAVSYTTLLNGLCRKKSLREAYKMLCRMKVKGCNPDIVHYNTVIVGFCRVGRPEDACKVFDDMCENGCLPNVVSYGSLVNGLCRKGLLDEANMYLEEMAGKGLVPHFSVFHGLVKGFCELGRMEEACKAIEVMLGLGVCPHLETWDVVTVGIYCDDEEKLGKDLLKVLNNEELNYLRSYKAWGGKF